MNLVVTVVVAPMATCGCKAVRLNHVYKKKTCTCHRLIRFYRHFAGSYEPAKPAFCRYRQEKTDAAMLCRRPFQQPACTFHRGCQLSSACKRCRAPTSRRSRLSADIGRGVRRRHDVPSTVFAADVYMLLAKPALINV